ncbi:MAG: putative heme/steroid binding protein [Clostridiaceae bacterium]|jgi:hypothetical protein|nr:putative heme/steroid binding protein [Clostridiaceae bacterium]
MPYFEFRTINEVLEENYNSNRNQKEVVLDELTQCDQKNKKYSYIEVEGIVYNIIEDLGKYAGGYRNKHRSKKSSKCQEHIISNELIGLENILKDYIIQIEKLHNQLLKCLGKKVGTVVSTKENEITEGIVTKSSIGKLDGLDGLAGGAVGGAVGGAAGGLAAGIKNIDKMEGVESQGKELGPGAIGGAAGVALVRKANQKFCNRDLFVALYCDFIILKIRN